MSTWAVVMAPILISTDLVSGIDNATLSILAAPEVIAVSQDTLGVQVGAISDFELMDYISQWICCRGFSVHESLSYYVPHKCPCRRCTGMRQFNFRLTISSEQDIARRIAHIYANPEQWPLTHLSINVNCRESVCLHPPQKGLSAGLGRSLVVLWLLRFLTAALKPQT